jgi:uncharacterized protein (DUF1778 family)
MRSRVKTRRLFIRLSEVDRQRIEQLAAASDLDISKYVRQAALNGDILSSRQSFQQLLAALKGCLEIVQGFEDDCEHDCNE